MREREVLIRVVFMVRVNGEGVEEDEDEDRNGHPQWVDMRSEFTLGRAAVGMKVVYET